MTDYITSYIENNVIREYASKTRDGYSLDVCDLSKHEISNLTEILLSHDPATRDILLDRIQEIINSRIPFVESQDYYDKGLTPVLDKVTGEVNWIRS